MPRCALLLLLTLGCSGSGRGTQRADGADGASADGADGADGGDTGAATPEDGAPWVRQELASPGSVTFTELHYHPGDDADLEYVELHNPMVLDMDLSGWALTGGVALDFPEGTVLPAGGFLVVAASPARLAEATGHAGALGPYDGQLANGGERVSLVSRSGRRIDSVRYGDTEPWTELADGSGFSLAKRDHDAASDRAEHWTVSAVRGGTPGALNGLDPLEQPVVRLLVPEDATWAYDASGADPADDWTEPGFDDSAWERGQAPLYAGAADGPVPATAWVTADNYFALYAGRADGSGLRWVGEDSDGGWSTVEEIDLELAADEHLYLAAWELSGDATTPQMLIGEVEVEGALVGTDAAAWEWVLGPPGDNPQGLPANPPPAAADLAAVVAQADAAATWAAPAAELARTAGPWGATVGGAFTDAAAFLWADTFDAASVTNTADTYALFRTLDPAVPPWGTVELDAVPVTLLLRAAFSFDADPAATDLLLECALDDGAVVYLNGAEVARFNLPAGEVDATTLAEAAVDGPEEVSAWVSAETLARGENILAVALHQATEDDADLAVACALTAETWAEERSASVLLHEVPAAGEAAPWVELVHTGDAAVSLDDLALVRSDGAPVALPAGSLDPGELLLVADLGAPFEAGERLFLTSADGEALLDGVRLGDRPRARMEESGPWRTPVAPTPGAPNRIERTDDVVLHEILYHRSPESSAGAPVTARGEEWIELYNRGDAPVDLSGWQLEDAVGYTFAAGTTLAPGAYLVVARDAAALGAAHPGIDVVGDLDGRLGNSGDRVLLRDAAGNPADEVRYFDGGRWPSAADGGGSSLELRDPWADNAAPEAWAASDESARSAWHTVSIRGRAGASVVGPDGLWEELVLGLLDAGEVLIDDVRLVSDPDGARTELLADGTFDAGADAWRLLGTHRHSRVEPDPDDPSNPVLRLVATGPTGHMHNHAETTLLAPVGTGEVELSFRARHLSGSNQLHSRLYFNRLPTTTLLPQAPHAGTPGAPNSTGVDNLGPTFDGLHADVAVPEPDEPVEVTTQVEDPDGVARVTLWAAVDGGAFEAVEMSEAAPGRYAATLPGQAAGALVQLYVEAEDAAGAVATFPAAGPDSRALYAVQDDAGSTTGLHDLRVLMTAADVALLHEETRLMSNHPVGATVVYREAEVFYDVGVRLKGSQRGRPMPARVGYGLRFADDQPFRGSHTSVMIDRSEGVGFGQREVLLNLAMTRAGSVSGEHNDLVHLIAPDPAYTGPAELQLDRFSNLVLDAQFEDGADGTRFEYELIYYPLTTDDGTAEGRKLPSPDRVVGVPITHLGDDKEHWRWIWLIKNNARFDDYAGAMALGALFDLPTEALLEQADAVLDVDQWLRAFAMATLAGMTDQYGGAGTPHNAQFYVRPSDGRVLFFPHDLDFYGGATMDVVGNDDLARLLEDPALLRAYYGHLDALLDDAYTTAYLAPWCDQLGALLPGQDFASHCAAVDARAAWVRAGSPESIEATFPPVDFAITTGGAALSSTSTSVTLEGRAGLAVHQVWWEEGGAPLDLTWEAAQTWRATVPVERGDNPVTLRALDRTGGEVGADAVVVTVE